MKSKKNNVARIKQFQILMTKYGCYHDLICLYNIYIYIIQFVFYSNGEALLPPSVFQVQKF